MHEIIDAVELAKRWQLPEPWVRGQTRERVPREDRIPHLKFGHYVRFEWGSPALDAWLAKHRKGEK